MKFLDRLTGGQLSELPNAFLPGRYCLLEPFMVNGQTCTRALWIAQRGWKVCFQLGWPEFRAQA